jgi:hypothetical protein
MRDLFVAEGGMDVRLGILDIKGVSNLIRRKNIYRWNIEIDHRYKVMWQDMSIIMSQLLKRNENE